MSKNANGAGGKVKKMPNRDLYRARYTDANGKQKNVYGKNYDECRKKLIEALSNKDKGLNFDAGNLTVGEYLNRWLVDSVQDTVRKNTYERYEQLVRIHIIPIIGKNKLAKLSPTHVRGLYREKLEAGLSPRSVQYIHTTLHKALKQAVMDALIPRNVTEAVKSPKPVSKEIRALNRDEVRSFLEAAKTDRLYSLYVLAISTGMRQGELLGLKWQDIDFESGKLSVRRSLVTTKNGLAFSDTKRKKSRRSIKLSQIAIEALRIHRKEQNEERLQCGDWQDSDLVFPKPNGEPTTKRPLTGTPFKGILKRAELPENITFHEATRHTCATLLLSRGVHPKLVQELLGHATISITLDTYSHVLPGMDDGLADTMDEAIS